MLSCELTVMRKYLEPVKLPCLHCYFVCTVKFSITFSKAVMCLWGPSVTVESVINTSPFTQPGLTLSLALLLGSVSADRGQGLQTDMNFSRRAPLSQGSGASRAANPTKSKRSHIVPKPCDPKQPSWVAARQRDTWPWIRTKWRNPFTVIGVGHVCFESVVKVLKWKYTLHKTKAFPCVCVFITAGLTTCGTDSLSIMQRALKTHGRLFKECTSPCDQCATAQANVKITHLLSVLYSFLCASELENIFVLVFRLARWVSLGEQNRSHCNFSLLFMDTVEKVVMFSLIVGQSPSETVYSVTF